MPANALQAQLQAARTIERTLDFGDFEGDRDTAGKVSNGVDGSTRSPSWSRIASFVADRPIMLKDEGFKVSIPRYETASVPGDGSQTTIDLSGDLPENNVGRQKVVVFEDGTRISPDSVDAANDTVTITGDGDGDTTVDLYYLDTQVTGLRLRKQSPTGDVVKELDAIQLALAHTRDQDKRPLSLDLRAMERYVPTDWRLDVEVKAGYEVNWEGSQSSVTPLNASLVLPTKQAQDEIPALSRAVRLSSAGETL